MSHVFRRKDGTDFRVILTLSRRFVILFRIGNVKNLLWYMYMLTKCILWKPQTTEDCNLMH